MYIEDMSHRCYFGHCGPEDSVRSVGWLDDKHPYNKGDAPSVFVARLRVHLKNPWQPVVCMGYHECELCETEPFAETRNLWIPGKRVMYVAPGMILHYIEAHKYLPPKKFVNAVLACPMQNTPEYEEAIEPFRTYWERPSSSAQPNVSFWKRWLGIGKV